MEAILKMRRRVIGLAREDQLHADPAPAGLADGTTYYFRAFAEKREPNWTGR